MGHRNKKTTQNPTIPGPNPPFDINNMGQLLNNIDINSMSNSLNNIDINQVMSILSKAFTPTTNSSPGNITPNVPNNDPSNDASNNTSNDVPITENFNPLKTFSMPNFNTMNSPTQSTLSPVLPPNDPTVMILNSLKPFLPSDKHIIVDNMIQIYGIKTVIDKIFPPSVQTNNFNAKNNSKGNKSEEAPRAEEEDTE